MANNDVRLDNTVPSVLDNPIRECLNDPIRKWAEASPFVALVRGVIQVWIKIFGFPDAVQSLSGWGSSPGLRTRKVEAIQTSLWKQIYANDLSEPDSRFTPTES